MSWGTFTHNIARLGLVCNAVDTAMQFYDYYWPMDDGDRGSVVPTAFHKKTGSVYDMSSSVNEGAAWDSGAWGNLSSADFTLTPFTLCSTRSVLEAVFNGSQQTVLDNVPALTDIRGFHHTAVLVAGVDQSYTIDVNQDWLFDFGGGSTQVRTRNPRLGVNIDHSAGEVTFTAAFEGGNPSVTIAFDNTQTVNIITVYFPAPAYSGTNFTHTFNCYINDEPMDTVSISGVPATATVTFDSHNWMYPFRNGTTKWLGLGMDFNSTSKHSDIWTAVQANSI